MHAGLDAPARGGLVLLWILGAFASPSPPAWEVLGGSVEDGATPHAVAPGHTPAVVLRWRNTSSQPVRVPAEPWLLAVTHASHLAPGAPETGYGWGGGRGTMPAEALRWLEVPAGEAAVITAPISTLDEQQPDPRLPGTWTVSLSQRSSVTGLADDQRAPELDGAVTIVVRGESSGLPSGRMTATVARDRQGWVVRVLNTTALDVWIPGPGLWVSECHWSGAEGRRSETTSVGGQRRYFSEDDATELAPGASLDLPTGCEIPRRSRQVKVTLSPISELWVSRPHDAPIVVSRGPLKATSATP